MITPYAVLSIGDDARHEWRVGALATLLPRADVRRVDSALLRRLPDAAALIVSTAAEARIARASGFRGGIVVDGPAVSPDDAVALRAIGAVTSSPDAAPGMLADALAAAVPLGEEGNPISVATDLQRARRLLAAGEVALTLQHTFNNPLSALLAEAQLLELEARDPEVGEAAKRIVSLARRLMDITRTLDGIREPVPGTGS